MLMVRWLASMMVHAGLVSKNDGVEAPANNTITVATNAVDNPIDTEF